MRLTAYERNNITPAQFGMFLFILCYFTQFVFSMSLFAEFGQVWSLNKSCFFFLGIEVSDSEERSDELRIW